MSFETAWSLGAGTKFGEKRMGWGGALGIGRFGWTSVASAKLIALAGKVGVDSRDSSDAALQRRLVVLLSIGCLPFTVLWSAIYVAAGAPLPAFVPTVYTVVTPIDTLAFNWTHNLRIYRFIQLLMILMLPSLLTISMGGFQESSAVIIWAALCPLVSLLVEDLRQTVRWIIGFVFLLIASAFLQPYLKPFGLPEAFVRWFFVLNIGTVIAIVFALLHYFVGQRNFFQERAEALLLNILPKEIAEALKSDRSTIAANYDAASILFADVVEFTPMASTMTPMRVVSLLNDVFHCFDDLVEKYDLEKIKTIGDCYMVAAGVPRERPDHAAVLVQLALDMQEAVSTRKFGGQTLRFRIGVNSGPVVAGVIGRKKFIYDLWGDAVNMASRMESHGESGTIQITRQTYNLVRDAFDCACRGTIRVKGADQIEAWLVLGRKGNRPSQTLNNSV